MKNYINHNKSMIKRNSNLELLRIILMLSIIAHHYVVNSGATGRFDFTHITANTLFLQFWGMWGKIAINAFVLITGYFMCTARLTWNRLFKLWFEILFYRYTIFFIFVIAGVQDISVKSLFKLVFSGFYHINGGFTAGFIAFYLFIPFLNRMIKTMNKREHLQLIGLLILIFTISGTFFLANSFHYVGWYMTIYFIGAYIRLYPCRWTESEKVAWIVTLGIVALSFASIVVVDYIGIRFGFEDYYYMVNDSHKLFALILGVSIFLIFKNMDIRNSKLINAIASTTFGILLIHANGDAMRQFLWKDLLKVESMYDARLGILVLHAVLSTLGIFCVCALIDYIRIYLIEKPVMKWIGKKSDDIDKWIQKVYPDVCISKDK